ncbi:hypothetical protein pb186bvf_007802 [Paramecium bursaria]
MVDILKVLYNLKYGNFCVFEKLSQNLYELLQIDEIMKNSLKQRVKVKWTYFSYGTKKIFHFNSAPLYFFMFFWSIIDYQI